MQKFQYDPDRWVDIAANKEVTVSTVPHVRLAKPGTLQLKVGTAWKLLGYGTEFKLKLPDISVLKADQAMAVFNDIQDQIETEGVPLTNLEKRPGDSALERLVKQSFMKERLRRRTAEEKRRAADKAEAKRRFDEGLEDEQRLVDPPPNVGEEPVVDDTATEPTTA